MSRQPSAAAPSVERSTSSQVERRPLSQYMRVDEIGDDVGWTIFDSGGDATPNAPKPRPDLSVLKRIKNFLTEDESSVEDDAFLGDETFVEADEVRVDYPFYDATTEKNVARPSSSAAFRSDKLNNREAAQTRQTQPPITTLTATQDPLPEIPENAENAENAEVAEVAESSESAATLATDPDEPPIAASETTETDDSTRPLGSVGLPAIAFGESSATSTPRTVDELLAAYERGWTPPFRDAAPSAGPSAGADSEADGGSTAGLIGGAVERAARERIDALASALEEAARTKVGELEAAARLKLDAAAFALEATATSKLETALDGLKRRAFAACAAIAVWGAFVAGGWYWLVRLISKCWGAAPKYRLVRDSDSSAAGSD